jgi:hypothetical protein
MTTQYSTKKGDQKTKKHSKLFSNFLVGLLCVFVCVCLCLVCVSVSVSCLCSVLSCSVLTLTFIASFAWLMSQVKAPAFPSATRILWLSFFSVSSSFDIYFPSIFASRQEVKKRLGGKERKATYRSLSFRNFQLPAKLGDKVSVPFVGTLTHPTKLPPL